MLSVILGCPFFRRPQPGHKRLKKKTALVFPHTEMPFSPWKLAKKDPILEIIGKGVKTIGKCLFWLPKKHISMVRLVKYGFQNGGPKMVPFFGFFWLSRKLKVI